MAGVLVPLAPGVEELEAVTLIDLLRRAGIDTVVAGLSPGPVKGSRGTVILPDTTLDRVIDRDFDMVVLPGGQPGATNLEAHPDLRRLLQRMAKAGRYTAAICAAPKVLAAAGLLDGKRATSFPGAIDIREYPRVQLESLDIVADGHVITSRGPGTAMDFALQLIEILAGAEKRRQVESALQRPAHHLNTNGA